MKWGKYAGGEGSKQEDDNDPTLAPAFRVAHTWLISGSSLAMIIPKQYAQKHRLTKPGPVVCVDTKEGILIKRLDL